MLHLQAIKFTKTQTPAALGILIANGIFFALTYYVPGMTDTMQELFALRIPYHDSFHAWQYVSHMFMHGHLPHLVFNMVGVYMFGTIFERIWGTKRFLVFYFIAGIGAALIFTGVNLYEFGKYIDILEENKVPFQTVHQFLTHNYIEGYTQLPYLDTEQEKSFWGIYNLSMLGASGALYGVLTAFGILFPNEKLMLIFLPIPIPAKYFVSGLLLMDLFSGLTGISIFGGGIAHFAHIGGAIIGFLLIQYWKKDLPRYEYR